MTDSVERLDWPLSRGRAVLDIPAGLLRFVTPAGKEYYQFKLHPFLEYQAAPGSGAQPPTGQGGEAPSTANQAAAAPSPKDVAGILRLVGKPDEDHVVLEAADAVCRLEIHVQRRGEFVDYWGVAGPLDVGRAGQPAQGAGQSNGIPSQSEGLSAVPAVRAMYYGQDGPDLASAGSTHQLEEFYHLCPDRYGSLIPATEPIRFRLGVLSFRFDAAWNFPHDSGRTIIPPYVAALRTGDDWLGVGTLEIPASEYGLSMSFRNGRSGIDFFYGGNVRLDRPYTFPKITFFDSPEKTAAVKTYIRRLYDDGLAVHNQQWEKDWAGPIYCFFSDQMYEYQVDRDTPDMRGEMTMTENYCNERFMERCLEFLVAKAIDYKVLILDYGWFICNGNWREHPTRFTNLKATIRKLQQMGKKVLLWYSPYFNAEGSPNYQQHPQISVRKPDGSPLTVTRFQIEVNYTSDFTHPAMRELAMRDIEYMLGPDGLDADGIKVDCTHQPPTVENIFHDPSWGLGERFCHNVHKLIYDHAKKVKPSCCVNTTSGNPLFNRTYDLHRIHDGLEYNLHAYEERAWAAWLCEASISDLDDWPSYDIYTTRANLRKIVYGSPSLYAARRRGGQRKPKSSYGYTKTPTEDELALLASIYELAGLVPVGPDQDIFIDPFAKVFERRYTAGPLAGFYSAKTISGHQAVAVYTPDKAYVVSLADAAVAVPLPKGAMDVKVNQVPRDAGPGAEAATGVGRAGQPAQGPAEGGPATRPGTEGATQPVRADIVGQAVVFNARRCGEQTRRFEISYKL